MSDVPRFFVPSVDPALQESGYAELARQCGRSAPSTAERIYSITYDHDGDEWTATVGEGLSGRRRRCRRVQGKKTEQMVRPSDPAMVLAIFPGNPYLVVTNHLRPDDVRSRWDNPFMAGRPKSVVYFSASEPVDGR